MKKLVLSLAAVTALCMVSCGNSDKATAEDSFAAQQALENPVEVEDLEVITETEVPADQSVEADDSRTPGQDLQDAADDVSEAGKTAVEKIKEKSAEKISDIKEKAANAVNEGTQKMSDAVDKAGNALENALK